MHSYFPVLISKQGEVNALKKFDQPNKKVTSPIIELIPDGMGLSKLAAELNRHWYFPYSQILIDYRRLPDAQLTEAAGLLRSLKVNGVNGVPVVYLDYDAPRRRIAKDLVKVKQPVCIRLTSASGSFLNTNARLKALMAELGVSPADLILVIDFCYIQPLNIEAFSRLAIDIWNGLPNKEQWRAPILLSGSFPEDLSKYEVREEPHTIRRTELTLFEQIKARGIPDVIYGDYGTKHPIRLPSQKHQASCSVKYTTKEHFKIYRGQIASANEFGNGQYIDHCKRLVQSADYSGESLCWGDREIRRISRENKHSPNAQPGSAMSWVTISWSHHVALVNSLSN